MLWRKRASGSPTSSLVRLRIGSLTPNSCPLKITRSLAPSKRRTRRCFFLGTARCGTQLRRRGQVQRTNRRRSICECHSAQHRTPTLACSTPNWGANRVASLPSPLVACAEIRWWCARRRGSRTARHFLRSTTSRTPGRRARFRRSRPPARCERCRIGSERILSWPLPTAPLTSDTLRNGTSWAMSRRSTPSARAACPIASSVSTCSRVTRSPQGPA